MTATPIVPLSLSLARRRRIGRRWPLRAAANVRAVMNGQAGGMVYVGDRPVLHCNLGIGNSSDIPDGSYEAITVSMVGTPEVVAQYKAERAERESAQRAVDAMLYESAERIAGRLI